MIPISTDAPIYHFPWMTLTLIGANIVASVITGLGFGPLADDWLLEFGNGLHPAQWISSLFLHFGLMHLIGNMIFLWGFGIIVEGKLGWWRFLVLYLVVGIISSFFDQCVMLGTHGTNTLPSELYSGQLIHEPERKAAREDAPLQDSQDEGTRDERVAVRREKALRKITRQLADKQAAAALATHQRIQRLDRGWKLDESKLLALAEGLFACRNWSTAAEMYEQYLADFGGSAAEARVRLRLARLFVQEQRRPKAALRLLEEINADSLPAKEREVQRAIVRRARKQIDEGVIELGG